MGEYVPPPFGILTLAAYLEAPVDNVEIEVVDCHAEGLDWEASKRGLGKSTGHTGGERPS